MPSRLEKLESMLAADPTDQTCRYMLAMEYDKQGNTDFSLQHFSFLMDASPPYVPAFLMAGQLLQRLGQTEKARSCFAVGIEQARSQNEEHAAAEMSQFLADLG